MGNDEELKLFPTSTLLIKLSPISILWYFYVFCVIYDIIQGVRERRGDEDT